MEFKYGIGEKVIYKGYTNMEQIEGNKYKIRRQLLHHNMEAYIVFGCDGYVMFANEMEPIPFKPRQHIKTHEFNS